MSCTPFKVLSTSRPTSVPHCLTRWELFQASSPQSFHTATPAPIAAVAPNTQGFNKLNPLVNEPICVVVPPILAVNPPNAEPEEAMSFPNPTETELPSAKAFVTSSIALFLDIAAIVSTKPLPKNPTPFVKVPVNLIAGPIAAVNAIILTIVCCVLGSAFEKDSAKFVTVLIIGLVACNASLNAFTKGPPNVIPTSTASFLSIFN